MLSVDECWTFLETYLTTSGLGAVSALPAGASPDTISQAEAKMGVVLTDDFRRFLSRHDGSGEFFISPYKIGGGGQGFLALEEISRLWETMVKIGESFEKQKEFGEQKGPIKRCYWNPCWIPFTDNQCGDHIFVDLDPAKGGTVGQIVDWWHEGGVSTFLASSLQEWLNEVMDDVRKGVYKFHTV